MQTSTSSDVCRASICRWRSEGDGLDVTVVLVEEKMALSVEVTEGTEDVCDEVEEGLSNKGEEGGGQNGGDEAVLVEDDGRGEDDKELRGMCVDECDVLTLVFVLIKGTDEEEGKRCEEVGWTALIGVALDLG